jgi:hypothetical protein
MLFGGAVGAAAAASGTSFPVLGGATDISTKVGGRRALEEPKRLVCPAIPPNATA